MHHNNRHRPARTAASIMTQMSQVVHNPVRDRFELWVAGDLVGVLGYSTETVDGHITMTVLHTVLYDEYTGHGLGTGLTRCAIAYARDTGARMRPVCTFTKHYLDTHPGIVALAPG
ncbi:MAG: GNAT family N-acetyltransferase [Gordonia sp. (in: high G+C Gram-positive bacteria)]